MKSAPVIKTFDLSRLGEAQVHSLLDVLRVDREQVVDLKFDATTRRLELALADDNAAGRMEAFVLQMIRTQRRIGRKILQEHRVEHLKCHDIDAALGISGDLTTLGPGLVGLRGSLLKLFRFFEGEFLRLAREFGSDENQYPTLLPAEILAEVGYFQHFPQHVTLCCHFPDNLQVLESVADEAKHSGRRLSQSYTARLAPPAHALTPGVCLPCYRQLRDITLGPGEVRTLTMQNHVFRYEGANFRPLTRGWDFTVRDIVFFGSYETMQARRLAVIERTIALCRELDLEATVELANDPFFLDASRDKAIYQRMGEVKYELLFHLPYRGEALAASSFNLHRDFYTSIYNTRQAGGQLAESACMGFGIDRWVYAFLSQKGLDPAAWPQRVISR